MCVSEIRIAISAFPAASTPKHRSPSVWVGSIARRPVNNKKGQVTKQKSKRKSESVAAVSQEPLTSIVNRSRRSRDLGDCIGTEQVHSYICSQVAGSPAKGTYSPLPDDPPVTRLIDFQESLTAAIRPFIGAISSEGFFSL